VNRFTGAKLAIFVGVCLTFTVYLAFTIGNVRPSHLWFLHKDYSLTANFDDVTGLNNGDAVKVAGVIVGKVDSIKVVDGPDTGKGRARVRFSVYKSVRLPTNTSASIRWRNLLGQRYVYLNPPAPGDAAPTVLRNGDHLADTTSVVDIGELFNELGPIITALNPDEVNQFIDAVSGALLGNEQNLDQTLDNLATVTAGVAGHDAEIGRLVGNVNTVAATVSSRDQEITRVLDNLVAISQTFSSNTQIVDDAVTNLSEVSTNLNRLLNDNQTQIGAILTNLEAVLNVVVDRLPTINSILSEFPTAAQSLLALGNVGQFLSLTAPCLSVEVAPGVDASIPCNTALNNPGPGGGTTTTTATPGVATKKGAAATAGPAAAGANGVDNFLNTLATAGSGSSGTSGTLRSGS
jgi:phospholipid/cholesterol/gamma-HCH transport system substrate-binding protein